MLAIIFSLSSHMYPERYPFSNCIPSTKSISVFMVLDSSIVMTPFSPTFSIASAIISPTSSFSEEIAATFAICSLPVTGWLISSIACTATSAAVFIPFLKTIAFAPAAIFFIPSFTSACARTVAVVVPSPAMSFVLVATSFTSCTPMFSKRSSSSISFAMVTPSFVINGAP